MFLAGGIIFVLGLAGVAPELLPSLKSSIQDGNPKLPAFIVVGAIMTSAGIRLAASTKECFSEWKHVLACSIALVLGPSACFWIPIASMTNPPINWGYPRTVEGFFHVLARGQYERLHPTDNLADYFGELGLYLEVTGDAYGWICLVPAIIPFIC